MEHVGAQAGHGVDECAVEFAVLIEDIGGGRFLRQGPEWSAILRD